MNCTRAVTLVLTALLTTNCATMMPSIAGKTVYHQSFEDTSFAEDGTTPSQTTRYLLDIKAPAGVKLDDITGMAYDWDSEAGRIGINKSSQFDSSGQVQAMVQLNQQQMETISNLTQALISAAAPVIGAKVTADAEARKAEIASKSLIRQSIIELLRDPEVLKFLQQSMPKPQIPVAPTAPTPPVAGPAPGLPGPAPVPVPDETPEL